MPVDETTELSAAESAHNTDHAKEKPAPAGAVKLTV
jgi:hypothetical protein